MWLSEGWVQDLCKTSAKQILIVMSNSCTLYTQLTEVHTMYGASCLSKQSKVRNAYLIRTVHSRWARQLSRPSCSPAIISLHYMWPIYRKCPLESNGQAQADKNVQVALIRVPAGIDLFSLSTRLECVQSIQSLLLKLWYVTSIQPMQSWLAHLGLALKNNVLLPGTFHHHFSES